MAPESLGDPADYSRDQTVSLHATDLSAELDKLTRQQHGDLGRGRSDPLFINFMDP